MGRLLIMACSATKHRVPAGGRVAAWDLYDGMGYRVAKKAERDGEFPPDVSVWILSAEHGLIPRGMAIAPYERRMDKARAAELSEEITREVLALLEAQNPSEVFLWMGGEYLRAIRLSALLRKAPGRVRTSSGMIGQQLSQLRAWLRGEDPPASAPELVLPQPEAQPATPRNRLLVHLEVLRESLTPAWRL